MLTKFKKMRTRLSWALGGNLIYALSQWLIITVIARFGSGEDLGIYSLGLAITAPIVMFFSFQLRTILATDAKNEYSFPQYLGGRIIHLTLSFIIIVPIAVLYSDNNKTIIIIIIMGIVKYIEALSDICMGYFQKEGNVDLIGKSQFYRGVSTAFVMSIIYISTQNLIISCLGLLIVMLLRYKLYDIKKLIPLTNVKPVFNKSWVSLILLTYPLGAASLISSLNTNVPRYFLDYFWGVEEVGIFSALYYVLIAGNMFLTPISLLAAPRIANAYNKDSVTAFIKINMKLAFLVSMIFLIFFLLVLVKGELIITILYGKKYALYSEEFIVISLSLLFAFVTTFFVLSTVAARVIKLQPIINLLVLIVTLFSSYFLIRDFSVLGASYSLLISRFFQMICSFGLLIYVILIKNKDENKKRNEY
jgi:O-antigen/teichoic acid export membrane protein